MNNELNIGDFVYNIAFVQMVNNINDNFYGKSLIATKHV